MAVDDALGRVTVVIEPRRRHFEFGGFDRLFLLRDAAFEFRDALRALLLRALLLAGFRIGGLGQWMEACLKADRVLVFGG